MYKYIFYRWATADTGLSLSPRPAIEAISRGGLITFNKGCESLLDLFVNNHLYGRGEAIKVGEKFGLRITSMLLPDASPWTLWKIHHFIRKAAHFVEYGLLALIVLGALRASTRRLPLTTRGTVPACTSSAPQLALSSKERRTASVTG